jgi:hypothetical protein
MDWIGDQREGGRRGISCGAEWLWDQREARMGAGADARESGKSTNIFFLHFVLFRGRDRDMLE